MTRLFQILPLLTLSLVVASGICDGQEKLSPPAAAPADDTKSKSPKGQEGAPKAEKGPAFVRIERDAKGNPLALQTSISSYTISEGDWKDVQIDLIGAVHIAHREYFQDLNRRFRAYDALLYELVADADGNVPEGKSDGNVRHPVGAIQVGMKDSLGLEFQLDEIDYKAKNFVHADMSPSEFAQDMNKRGDGFISMFSRMMGAGIAAQSSQAGKGQDVKMLMAMVSGNKLQMRQAMAEQFENMEVQMAGFADKSGRSTLVTERNAKAFEVMKEQLKAGKKKIGVFYGAGHLSDMDKRLVEDFQAKRGETIWLTAWKLAESK